MRTDRDRKKKQRKSDDPIILKELSKIAEQTMQEVMRQLMDEIDKEWIRQGGTVSK